MSDQQLKYGEYALERMLGRGGMGEVWLARDPRLDRMVAIKTVRPDFVSAAGAVERFQREARAIAKLNHPNIVSVYQLGEDSGTHFFVMEFVEGESLADMLARTGPLQPRYCLGLMSQVAEALDYAAGEGIVHRDIKPGNIMTDRFGRARVGDFGLAKMLEHDVNMTTTGVAMGSPNYMSPEAARGEMLDARSDMYSLGITMFQLLMGYLPFTANTAAILLVRHMQDPLPEPPELAAMEGGRVLEVIRRLTAKAREARYPDFGELKREIDDIIVNGSTRTAMSPPAPAPGTSQPAGPSDTVNAIPMPTGQMPGPGGMFGVSTLGLPSSANPTPQPSTNSSSGSIIIETKPRTFLVLGILAGVGVAVVAAAGYILFRDATTNERPRREFDGRTSESGQMSNAPREESTPATTTAFVENADTRPPPPVATKAPVDDKLTPADVSSDYMELHGKMAFDRLITVLEDVIKRPDVSATKIQDAKTLQANYRLLSHCKQTVLAALDRAPSGLILQMPRGTTLTYVGKNADGSWSFRQSDGSIDTYSTDTLHPPVFIELLKKFLPQRTDALATARTMYPPPDNNSSGGMTGGGVSNTGASPGAGNQFGGRPRGGQPGGRPQGGPPGRRPQ